MKKLVCTYFTGTGPTTQGIFEVRDGGYPGTNKELELGQFVGAQVLSIRRLETGLLTLELEVDTGGANTAFGDEPGEEDRDPSNIWLRAGYIWGMARRLPPDDDQMFLFRAARSLVAFAKGLTAPTEESCSTCGDLHPGQPCAAVEQPSAEQKIEQLQARVTEMHKTIAMTSRNAAKILADAEQLKRDGELFQLSILRAAGLPVGTSMAALLSVLLEKRWSLKEIKAAWQKARDGGAAGALSEEDTESGWNHMQAALLGEDV